MGSDGIGSSGGERIIVGFIPAGLTFWTSSKWGFSNQPLFRARIQVSGRTAAPFPLASLSGEGLEGGVAAVPGLFRNLIGGIVQRC